MSDTWHMRRALRLAEKAGGLTLPNPMVGAVIVKNGERIGEGWHSGHGKAHAEIEALKNCKEDPKGSTLFVTLEPCSKTGKTGPCTLAIIKSGIKKVVIATEDPSQNGIEELKKAGIEVETGLLNDAARELNREFFTFEEEKRPFITLKAAISLNGKLAEKRGVQTQLTSKGAIKAVHKLRAKHQAVLIGSGTALTDNPHLGVRFAEGQDPLRIVLQGKTELPKTLQIFRDENFLIIKEQNVKEILKILHEKNIKSVLVEGGQKVFSKFLEAQAVDEIKLFIAPILLGARALDFTENDMEISLSGISVQKLGPDTLITGTPKWDSSNG